MKFKLGMADVFQYLAFVILKRDALAVSILGLARSPTKSPCFFLSLNLFQYLGSRGAQHEDISGNASATGFNTWAREEPNLSGRAGSRINQGFNTWAREEPNPCPHLMPPAPFPVSILGLARSPTGRRCRCPAPPVRFQYLGSRGAQPRTGL